MNTVLLVLTIIMPGDKPDIIHRFPESSIEQCWKDAAEFVQAASTMIADVEGAKGVGAACAVKAEERT